MNRWPIFSDWNAFRLIMICLWVWWIVGCDRPDTQPAGTSNVPVSVEPTITPVATATMRGGCLFGPAIMGCDN